MRQHIRRFDFRRRALLIGGVLALVVALVGTIAEWRRPSPTRVATGSLAQLGEFSLQLIERGDDRVDIRAEDRLLRGETAVYIDQQAARDDVIRRYDGRFRIARPRNADGDLALVEIDRANSGGGHVRYRYVSLAGDGRVVERWRDLPPAQAKTQLAKDLYGVPPRRVGVLSPYCAALAGGAALLLALPAAPRRRLFAVVMVALLIALAINLAWPLMINIGLRQTLPGVVVATFVTLALAAWTGHRVQRRIAARSVLRGGALGAVFGVVLLSVFVVAETTTRGFLARPDESADAVLALGLLASAVSAWTMLALPAALAGAIYAVLVRRLPALAA